MRVVSRPGGVSIVDFSVPGEDTAGLLLCEEAAESLEAPRVDEASQARRSSGGHVPLFVQMLRDVDGPALGVRDVVPFEGLSETPRVVSCRAVS